MSNKKYAVAKCYSYKRGKVVDICLLDGAPIEKTESTMCRKNPEICVKNKKKTQLGDYRT